MQGLTARLLLVSSLMMLVGCPAKDWIKREDSYLSVEQYKNMTEVIRINDNLYRVKKGEELNQNGITQLFIDLQLYENSPKDTQKKTFNAIKSAYVSEKSALNTLLYVSVLLETQNNDAKAYRILSKIDYVLMRKEDKNLFNLALLLRGLLERNKVLVRHNSGLNKTLETNNTQYELAMEKIHHLNKQVDELKAIEESLHAREVGIDRENR